MTGDSSLVKNDKNRSPVSGHHTLIIISNTSWNLFNFRRPLMKRLHELGYEVIAVAPRDEYSEQLMSEGFRYIELPMNNKGTNPVEDMGLALRMFRMFRAERPDVVLTYTPKPNIYGCIAGRFSGTPVLPNISGLGATFIRENLITRIIKLLYRLALQHPKRVFFQNYDDLNLFVELGLVHRDVAERIPGSGIDTRQFAPPEQKQSQSQNSGVTFLLVARLLWDKGVGEYVEAARALKQRYPDARFHLLGFLDVENPQAVARCDVEKWQQEGVIDYLGVTDRVIDVMREADCVVLPSYREGLPRTLIEAASLAKPIVATDVPGCRDVVDDGITGYLCQVRNAEDLAAKMAMVITLPREARQAMGIKGRQKAIAEFDESLVIDAYLNVLGSGLAL